MLPQVQVLGGVYPGDCGHENPGAGSVRLDHLKTVVLILQTRVSEVTERRVQSSASPRGEA